MSQHVCIDKDRFEQILNVCRDGTCAYLEGQLAYFYLQGIGTEYDYLKALFWFQKSAEGGCLTSQHFLGIHLSEQKYHNDKFTLKKAERYLMMSLEHPGDKYYSISEPDILSRIEIIETQIKMIELEELEREKGLRNYFNIDRN